MLLPPHHQNAVKMGVTYLAVDEIEMRSDVFSEQQSYWPLPVHETALVTDVAATPGGSQVSIYVKGTYLYMLYEQEQTVTNDVL